MHYMIEHLEAVEAGQITRLLLNLPPRCMKSILTNVMYGSWLWARRPETRMLSFSYSDSLAKKFNIDRRNIMQSNLYKQLFPDVKLKGDMNTQKKIENTKTGMMLASPMPGTATGEGGDLIIIDDPHDPQGAESDAERGKQVDYFRQSIPSRLNDKQTGAIIVVMQRLNQGDVSGVALELDDYVHVKLPSEERLERTLIFPMSGRTIHRKKGDVLWPAREPQETLDKLKRMLGEYGYTGQYLQEPSPLSGGMVKEAWWQFYTKIEEPITRWCLSVDAAFKKSDTSDFIVIQRWGIGVSGRMYLTEMVRERMTFIETVDAILVMRRRNDILYIEEKANGSAIIDVLRRKVSGVIAYNPTESKIARLQAVSPWIQAESVYIYKFAPWKQIFIDEFNFFPNGKNDDIVDATTQAIIKIKDIRPGELREPVVDDVRHFAPAVQHDGDGERWEDELFSDFSGEFNG